MVHLVLSMKNNHPIKWEFRTRSITHASVGNSNIMPKMFWCKSRAAWPTRQGQGHGGSCHTNTSACIRGRLPISPPEDHWPLGTPTFLASYSFQSGFRKSCENAAVCPRVPHVSDTTPRSAIRVIGAVKCFTQPLGREGHSAREAGLQEISPVCAPRNQWEDAD